MFLAHISEDRQREQSILEHLRGTAALAGDFADSFGCREWGYGCGLVHDIGKYSQSFQRRLHGGAITDHATAGAKELYRKKNILAAYCVAGHHSGLPDGGTVGDSGGEPTLMGRLKKEVDGYREFQKEVEIPDFPAPPLRPLGKGGFTASFFARMVFSCLVDADFLDTEEFMSLKAVKRGGGDSMAALFSRLETYVGPWLSGADIDTINGRRTQILKACLKKGEERQGLFQLTVPTGGGKTVSSLAFALRHARTHHLKRIIYVIPYTSIIEQNAAVFREILGNGNVLEDHCNVVCESAEELKLWQLAAENWDRPVIVTTNVQFFESLFSNKTSKCRKLHNIAESVVIFDEAQMLPVQYLKPCVRAIAELTLHYRCSAVLCTATQPSLEGMFPDGMRPVEICPDVEGQYQFFKRTEIRNLRELSQEELLCRLKAESQALCILNSRKRAQRIYKELEGEGTYHLSTLMYPEHRKRLLQEIRKRLKNGQVCRLVATSLVEAGVDFDFQTVYRELAGIDSVIQAAGRCNREGRRRREDSVTFVFTMEKAEDIHLPLELSLPASVAGQVTEQYEDVASLEAIREYFDRLYRFKGESLDSKGIVEQLENAARSFLFPFQRVAEQFHLIEGDTRTIFIDREPGAAEILERIRRGEQSRSLVREAGHYCVNVYQNEFEHLNGAGLLEALPLDLFRLRDPERYTEEMGLSPDVQRGDALIW